VRRALLILLLALCALGAGCGSSSAQSCADVKAPAARKDGGAKAPKERLDPGKTYNLVFKTSCGSFTVTLDLATAPATASSLVALARSGFYDNTVFHRIVPDFVIQGGDPTQSGNGGPGYKTVDVPPPDATYTKGVVAMAKTSVEPPGTAGSQFFIVTGANLDLPAEYAVVGNVTSGIGIVEQIGKLGNAETEEPTRPVVIDSVTVEEQ
jgi:cyclophilin family peptidyl-prolyl cis-trans isomerase